MKRNWITAVAIAALVGLVFSPLVKLALAQSVTGANSIGLPLSVANGGTGTATGGITTVVLATPVNGTFTTACTGGTLTDSTTYYYRVTATNSVGETLGSTETSKATGACSGANTSTITVTWAAVTNAAAYNVYGRTTGAETKITASIGTTTLSYTDTGSALSGALPTRNSTADETHAGNIMSTSPNALTLLGNVGANSGPAVIIDNLTQQNANKYILSIRSGGVEEFSFRSGSQSASAVLFGGTGTDTDFRVDTFNALPLNIGTSSATTVSISHSGQTTAIGGALTVATVNSVTSVSEHDFSAVVPVIATASLPAGTIISQTVVTNASTLVAGSNATTSVAGVGAGNTVVRLCSDGATCGAGNIYLTCTFATATVQVVACTLTKSAVAAGTTLSWEVGTAPVTTWGQVNFNAHLTTP